MKLKKNDFVAVIAGKNKGKKGKVLRAYSIDRTVIIEGINYVKKCVRPTQENPQGGFSNMEAKLTASNVQLVCPKCSKNTRIGTQLLADGTKQRICKKCQEII